MEGGTNMSEQSSKLSRGGDEMGMTDAQFKTHLLEDLDNWQRIHALATANNDKEVQAEAEKQINKINTALKF